jgi:NAD(P)-dependent dehydrogenase (short-subunit alcohol dehydrogenase family)
MKDMVKDKVIVITGSSSGLGKGLAEILAVQGAKVVVSAPNLPADTKALESIAIAIGGDAVTADVRNENEVDSLAKKAVEHFGRIDIWINNAGIWLPKAPIEDIDMKKARDLFDVNVFGCLNGCRAALKVMKKQGSGVIVNIVSTAALSGRAFSLVYSASKHAERGVTDSLREELKEEKSRIKVIGIYPGGMKTDLFGKAKPDDYDKYMSVESVAHKIIVNLGKNDPQDELVIEA